MKARAKVEEVGRLVGYARVSTADQTTQMQIAALTKAGVSPANLHEEQVSGVAVKRPALEAAVGSVDQLRKAPSALASRACARSWCCGLVQVVQ